MIFLPSKKVKIMNFLLWLLAKNKIENEELRILHSKFKILNSFYLLPSKI